MPLGVVERLVREQVGGDELQVGLEGRPLRFAHAQAELTQLLARVGRHVVVHVEYVLGVVERVADALDDLHRVALADGADGRVTLSPYRLRVLLERQDVHIPFLSFHQ